MLHVADTEAALGRLEQGGFRIVEFPKYWVRPHPLFFGEAGAHVLKCIDGVQVVHNLGGLDLRLAATQEVDKFYTEVCAQTHAPCC